MSELGRFLEVVYGPQDAFRTVQGTLHHWCNEELAESISDDGRPIGRRKARPPSEEPTIVSAHISFFLATPDRLRVAKRIAKGEKAKTSLAIVNRKGWWSRDDDGRVETDEMKSAPQGIRAGMERS